MRVILLHIFFCTALAGYSQTVFLKVHRNITGGNNPANELFTLDSCYNKGYCKDSVLFYKTMVSLKLGNIQSAKKNIKSLKKSFPGFTEIHYLNGLVYFSDENYGKCVEEFNLAVKANPKNIKALYNRSVALGVMEEYLSSIEDLSACININPDYAQAYYSRAYWYEYTGNYGEAIKDYEQAIRLDPKNYDAYFGLAFVCHNQNEINRACEALNQAIKEGSQIAVDLKEIFCR